MRITRKLVIGFLAVSLLALLAVLAGPWKSSGAEAGATRCTRHATGSCAHVGRNTLAPGARHTVGIDTSSRPGYEGPEPGGAP